MLHTAYIKRVMAVTRGKIHGPGGEAEMLGINADTLCTRMKKPGIPFGRYWKVKTGKQQDGGPVIIGIGPMRKKLHGKSARIRPCG